MRYLYAGALTAHHPVQVVSHPVYSETLGGDNTGRQHNVDVGESCHTRIQQLRDGGTRIQIMDGILEIKHQPKTYCLRHFIIDVEFYGKICQKRGCNHESQGVVALSPQFVILGKIISKDLTVGDDKRDKNIYAIIASSEKYTLLKIENIF